MNKNSLIFLLVLIKIIAFPHYSFSAPNDVYIKHDTSTIGKHLNAYRYLINTDSVTAKSELEKAFRLSKETGYLKGIAYSAKELGTYYLDRFDMNNAEKLFLESFEAFRQVGNKLMESNMANNLGTIAEKKGDYANAISRYLYAYEIYDSLENPEGLSAIVNNIGVVYYLMGASEKALQFFQMSATIKKQFRDTISLINTYQNLGNVYFDLWQYDSAKYYYQECIALTTILDDALHAGKAYNSLGMMAMMENDYQQARQLFNKALNASRQKNDLQNVSSIWDNMGMLCIQQRDFTRAEAYFDSSLVFARDNGLKEEMKNTYFHLSEVFAAQENYKEAFINLQYYEELNSELLLEKGSVAGVEALFIKQKQENQILRLEQQQQRRKTQIIFLSSLLVIVIIASAMGMIIYQLHQKSVIESKIALLEKERYQAVIEAQEMERKRIAGDLHDSVGQMLSLSKLHLSELMDASLQLSKELEDSCLRSMQLIDEACQEVRNISHNLMPGPLVRLGLIAALKDLIRKINLSGKILVNLESNLADKRLDEKTEISLYRILQEIFNNIIKHADASSVQLQIQQNQEGKLAISVTDDGKGFDTSAITLSDGIGWKNIYSRLAIINGEMRINSIKNSGTTITIDVF